MDAGARKIIATEFEACVVNTIRRLDNEETNRPFHAALLSEEALFWSRFERSFSTSFGQRVIETISRVAALAGGAEESRCQKESVFSLDEGLLSAIEGHISSLRSKSTGMASQSFVDVVKTIANAPLTGKTTNVRVISDLWWKKNGQNYYMSIKTVKPNIDQAAEAKRDLLKLAMMDRECKPHFGLYYNPFGEDRQDYSWTPPGRIFDFRTDPVVLIGRDYWNTLGGQGCYEEILEIAREVGKKTLQHILAIPR